MGGLGLVLSISKQLPKVRSRFCTIMLIFLPNSLSLMLPSYSHELTYYFYQFGDQKLSSVNDQKIQLTVQTHFGYTSTY